MGEPPEEQPKERQDTDASLEFERTKTDQELAGRRAEVEGSRAREQLAQQLPPAANPLGDEGDALHGACPHGLRVDCVPCGTRRNGHQF